MYFKVIPASTKISTRVKRLKKSEGVAIVEILNRVAREGLTEEVTTEQRPEGCERVCCVDIGRKSFRAKGTAHAKL